MYRYKWLIMHTYIDSSINYSYSKPQKQQPLVKHMYLYSVQYKLNYMHFMSF